MKAFILCALLLFVVAANAGRVAMPVMRSDDQDYDVGELNSLCENGRMIDNVEECEKAANQLNQDFGGEEEESGYPGGCYLWYGTVYFNKHAGVKEAESQPICGLEPEPPTCDYGPYCALIDCKTTGATDLCPDKCSTLEGKKAACHSATADMCQVSAKRGVCKNKDINQKFLENGDDSDQDEINYFEDYFENYYDQDNADITLCPQCGCNDYHILPPASSCFTESNGRGKPAFYRIMNAKDCRDAANRLNIDFEEATQNNSDYPEGCYVRDGTVYYNANFEQYPVTQEKSLPICGLEKCKRILGKENDDCTNNRYCHCWTGTCVDYEQLGPVCDDGGFNYIPEETNNTYLGNPDYEDPDEYKHDWLE